MGATQFIIQGLIDECQAGSKVARVALLDFDVPQALLGISPTLDAVVKYVDRGFSIVPQLPGAKQPCVRCKQYQSERPSVAELYEWYDYWSDAGIAVVPGELHAEYK